MGFLDELLPLMPHTVTLEPAAAWDAYGKVTSYGSLESYRGRVSYQHRKVISQRSGSVGMEVVASGNVVLAGTPTVGPDDRLTLPDGTTPLILSWSRHSDESGELFVRVYFG